MSRYRFWTPEEQQFLERNCKAMDIETIGNKLKLKGVKDNNEGNKII
ncbi:hypothetical protein [Clostridium niameyense]|nr:hypothetical protein [Clostridium niameyense]